MVGQIITQKSETDNSSIYLIFDNGSGLTQTSEGKNYRSMMHYMEHLVFEDINKYLQEYSDNCITYNAYTSTYNTVFHLDGLDDILNKYIYDFCNGIANVEVSKEAFEKERNIILSEYNEGMGDREECFSYVMYKYFFNHSSVIGDKDVIENITYDEFLEFKENFHKPTKIIYTSKNFELDESKFDFELVDHDYFLDQIPMIEGFNEHEEFEIEIAQDYKDLDNCSFVAISEKIIEEDFPKINFINNLLAGNLTSKLFELREKHGLCYSLGLYLSPLNYKQAVNTFYTDCSYEDAQEVEDRFFEIMSTVKESITQETIDKVRKKQIINERKIAIDLYKVPDYYLYTEWNDKTFLNDITLEEVHGLIDKYYLDVEYIVLTDKELYDGIDIE